ncbi:hypothetical protein COZ61_02135 [Candidatus Berkelbacteria bacterium CG_4_8_14_3_um_filter_33_6]|uniref:Uncharacterized protein n=1 Tax=Candidatus Berkelbacteria bacterium CG_4_10_14_0_2_um_filter_35_9_33_12 TaxID=1974499 RepID=A0A2M7W4E6_9BACT|nr:MAG: hypothetical protein COX10_02085 [Candidatus Berkelbacteria bacterium CG23_combo_of_CG06-09_8_20_14_all_33_15]PIS08223.1 MAG: hypothetical protein COT76_02540 [Candidatus Berkelbacteria bacterium CG10_big_fil_rev_8_21_14_0_10_33_10]PIX30998.1 MAG: hypothetical protein COZ61_02135 [Candidatus Berkelbacteria bacterium CG_4_8_14_3_um_filter_33_6]PIZ28440.1 MAG: hypothetical protein COY43_00375 [Candidatus Berkelbacteria bacterium CG_4_10_14_0_8_um_filter_35_9_33_8]PJA20116.1 MAG: hypotheti
MTEKIKYNLFSIFSSTLVAFAIWIYILYNLDPFSVDILAILSFFGSLFFWLSGILTMIMIFVRINFFSKNSINTNISSSIRQATILSILVVGLLGLNSLNVLNTLQAGILVFIAILLEFFIKAIINN